jgi:hypothetical protein
VAPPVGFCGLCADTADVIIIANVNAKKSLFHLFLLVTALADVVPGAARGPSHVDASTAIAFVMPGQPLAKVHGTLGRALIASHTVSCQCGVGRRAVWCGCVDVLAAPVPTLD